MLCEDAILENELKKYENRGLLRNLEKQSEYKIDFCSNDYLGFAHSQSLYDIFLNKLKKYNYHVKLGSTGSRLISGNLPLFDKLEQDISKFHNAEAGLIFNSGYNANLGLFSSIPQKKDIIIYDILSHASIRDGIRLSFAKSASFKHNNIDDLEKKIINFISRSKQLRKYRGNIYVAVESLYSMDGDFAPLQILVSLCNKYGAYLIVDEAHSSGVIGKRGEGLVSQLNLEGDIFARVHTFGKALGCHGAIILGSQRLKNFLVTKARSFIYTTALSNYDLLAIDCAYEHLKKNSKMIQKLNKNIILFKSLFQKSMKKYFLESTSQIQSFLIHDFNNIKKTIQIIKESGIHIKVILPPTVPKNRERIRICIHSFNTKDEIIKLHTKLLTSL